MSRRWSRGSAARRFVAGRSAARHLADRRSAAPRFVAGRSSARRFVVRRGTSIALAGALLLVGLPGGPGPARVLADCSTIGLPMPGLADARGAAFIGTVRARDRDPQTGDTRYTWDVQRVFAGPLERGPLSSVVAGCTGSHPHLGVRYLVSTTDAELLDVTRTITWRLWRNGDVSVDPQYMRLVDYPAEVRAIRTAEAALDAVAPGWSGRIPPARPRPVGALRGIWSPMAEAPFASMGAVSAWTGAELLVIAGEKVAAWDPVTDAWRRPAAPPIPVSDAIRSVPVWTGSELLVWRTDAVAGGLALDPAADAWRALPVPPVDGWIVAGAWTGDRAIVVTSDWETAAYDPVLDTWTALRPIPRPTDLPATTEAWLPGRLVWTGSKLYALGAFSIREAGTPIWQHVPETGGWTQPGTTPFPGGATGMTAVGEALLFAGGEVRERGGGTVIQVFDPAARSWTTLAVDCAPESGPAVWTGRALLGGDLLLDPSTGRCLRLPDADDRVRRDAVEVWTGTELVRWSGGQGEETPPLPDGVRFDPARPAARHGLQPVGTLRIMSRMSDRLAVSSAMTESPAP